MRVPRNWASVVGDSSPLMAEQPLGAATPQQKGVGTAGPRRLTGTVRRRNVLPSSPPPCHQSLTMLALLDRYLAATDVSPRYEESLRRTAKRAAAYGLTRVCQLEAKTVNEFLVALGKNGLSATTVHNIRRELLTLWRFAHACGLTDEYPLRVRKISAKIKPPQAWSHADLCHLVTVAGKDQARISNRVRVRRCDVLPAWISIGYESGLRLNDLLNLKADQIRNGCICLRASKTGKTTIRRLSPQTQQLCQTLVEQSPDGTVFRWAMPRRRAIQTVKKFLVENGYPGSTQWLRRSGATQIERVSPGMATRWLDHSNPALARKHYLDQTLIEAPPSPPPLTLALPRSE